MVPLVLLAIIMFGCQGVESPLDIDENDRILASAGNKNLLLSEVIPLMNDSLSSRDSTIFLQNYAERWVRDQLMIREAERNIPDNVDIDQLVNDYRSSLLVHHYEQKMIGDRLDTVVTEEQILDFYQKNKDQFQNDQDLVRAYLIKLKKPFPDQRKMESWWQEPSGANLNALRNYGQNYAAYFNLERDKWMEYDEIARQLPRGSIRFNDLKPDYERNFADFNYQYFIKVFETVKSTDNPPVDLVADQAKMIILHERKLRLLDRIKQELYDKAIRESDVKILIK